MKSPTVLRALLAAALPLASCADLAKDYPERRYHDVETARGAAVREKAPLTVLEVEHLDISQRFESSEIVRRTGDLTWEADYYDVLFVPPAAMVTEETRKWLLASGLFEHVVDVSSLAEATHVLEGNVTALYGDLRSEPRAAIEVQFVLLDRRVEPPAIVHSATYSESVAVENGAAAAIVGGWTRGLEAILSRLEDDLSRAPLAAAK